MTSAEHVTGRAARRRDLLGVGCVPLLVLGALLWALAGPAEPVGTVSVAVINRDEVVVIDEQPLLFGRELTADLLGSDEPGYAWEITDAATAAQGLDDGRFAAAVSIPSDFTATALAAATSQSADPRRAVVDITTSVRSRSVQDALVTVVTTTADRLVAELRAQSSGATPAPTPVDIVDVNAPRADAGETAADSRPAFAAFALWVGALATFLVLAATPVRTLGSAQPSIVLASRALRPAALVGAAQGLLVAALLAGQVPVSSVAALCVVGVVSGTAFAALVQGLVASLGGVGRLLAAAVAAVTLATGVSTTTPAALDGLAALLPTAQTVTAVEAASTGAGGAATAVVGLLAWAVVGIVLTTWAVGRQRKVAAAQVLADADDQQVRIDDPGLGRRNGTARHALGTVADPEMWLTRPIPVVRANDLFDDRP